MRAMIWDCELYSSNVTGLSTRSVGEVAHDNLDEYTPLEVQNAVVAFLTVEDGDDAESVSLDEIVGEIDAAAQNWGRNQIVIVPFAHLGSQLSPAKNAQEMFNTLEFVLNKMTSYKIYRDHFGSDKSLDIKLIGHPGNVRFRSLNKNK